MSKIVGGIPFVLTFFCYNGETSQIYTALKYQINTIYLSSSLCKVQHWLILCVKSQERAEV